MTDRDKNNRRRQAVNDWLEAWSPLIAVVLIVGAMFALAFFARNTP